MEKIEYSKDRKYLLLLGQVLDRSLCDMMNDPMFIDNKERICRNFSNTQNFHEALNNHARQITGNIAFTFILLSMTLPSLSKIEEVCYCGHLQSKHAGLNGHGHCQIEDCDCEQYTFKSFV